MSKTPGGFRALKVRNPSGAYIFCTEQKQIIGSAPEIVRPELLIFSCPCYFYFPLSGKPWG